MRVDIPLDSFPITQNSTHKNYHHINKFNDIYMIIPKGMKCYLWFKSVEPKETLLVYFKKGKPYCRHICVSTENKNFQNTILFGTMVGKTDFVIEDISYHGGPMRMHFTQ